MKYLAIGLITFAGITTLYAATRIGPTTTATFGTVEEIMAAQNTYRSLKGKYFQVMQNNYLPSYETGDTKTALGKTLPTSTQVNIYSGPSGDGYQIVWTDASGTHATSTGPQAKAFSYDIPIPLATTTP